MNVLILSAGTRVKLVEYFVRENKGKGRVVATDMSRLAPALYAADKHYIVPPITSPNYIDTVLDICKKEKIGGVFSLIDPELSLLAKNAEKFACHGVTVAVSPYEQCEMSLDKMKMYEFLKENGYKCAKSYVDKARFYDDLAKGDITFPVMVKPVCGSASLSVAKAEDEKTLETLLSRGEKLMIQQFLTGNEIGADVYVDAISGKVTSVFTKQKKLMRAGETDKATSFKDEKLFMLISEFVEKAGYRYMIDVDLFDCDGEYYISEVNPRFGGGYPHAYECGANHVKMLLNNLEGKENAVKIGDYEQNVSMMKYCELKILREQEQ